ISAPPPVVTAEDLRNLAVGTSREEVLKQGPPSSRVTMFDDGHLHEIFHYARNESAIGEVQLVDGAVSSVEVK
ncbi:MAG TPA: hypothetical protein VFW83_03970, partial [Bryobacteraceae bacterium]|nr:hypothetical protein [Bryobacteraceae bacterium]